MYDCIPTIGLRGGLGQGEWTVVVTVISMWMVELAREEIIDVITMWHRLMATSVVTTWACHVDLL